MRKLKSYSLNSQQKVNTQPLNTGAGSNLKKWCCPRALCWLESSMSRSGWADSTAGSTHHTSMLQASSKLKEFKCWLWCRSMGKVVEKTNQMIWLLWYYIYDLEVLSMVWKKRVYCNSWENFPFWNSTLNSLLDFTTVFNMRRYSAMTDLRINISFCTSELPKAVETN